MTLNYPQNVCDIYVQYINLSCVEMYRAGLCEITAGLKLEMSTDFKMKRTRRSFYGIEIRQQIKSNVGQS